MILRPALRIEDGWRSRLSTLGRYLGALGYDLEIAAVAGAERQLHLPNDDDYVAPLLGATVTGR